jgi:hypothetical protein
MANIKIQWSLPDFEYDYFELKYSLKSDSNISYSYLSTTDNSVIITGLEDNTIYLGGVRTVKDNYKSEWVFFEINTCDIQFPTPTVTPTISLTPTSSVVPTPTPTITLTASNILPICTEGPEILEITSVNNNSLSFEFHGIDVFDIRWDIYQNNLLVRHGIVSPSSSNVTINYSYLNDGNYKIDIQGASCTSSVSSMIFNISSALPQPTSSVTPTITPTPTITASPNEGGMQIFDIGNPFLNVAKETTTGTFSPQKFPNVTIPTYYDSRIDNQTPYFMITMNNDLLSVFNNNGITPFQKGVWSWRNNQFQQCVDFWDNCPGIDYSNFISARPYNQRYDLLILPNFVPLPGVDIETYFRTKTTEESYNLGTSLGGAFGLGDSPDGYKTRRAVHENDVEIGLVVGNEVEPCKRMASFFGGIADKSLGYVFAEYLNVFHTLGYPSLGRYPDENGNYSEFFPKDDNTGTWRITSYWWNDFTLNGVSKRLRDYPNLYGVEEMAHFSEDSWEQDRLVYSPTGTYLRKVNHFGTQYDLTGVNGYNVDHTLGKSISNIETDVAYHEKYGRDAIHMFKIVCDRGDVWLWEDTAEYNSYGDRSVLALPRNVAFMGIILLYMSGSRGEQAWGTPQNDSPGDGYNSLFGASTVLHTPINVNGENIVLASLRPNLTFHKWLTYQSYDNGQTWIQHKAIEWGKSKNYLPLRIATTNDGHIVIFACRPYNVEPLSIRWKVDINGTTHYGSIGSNDWYSCYPVEEPNRKDYYFKIIKV